MALGVAAIIFASLPLGAMGVSSHLDLFLTSTVDAVGPTGASHFPANLDASSLIGVSSHLLRAALGPVAFPSLTAGVTSQRDETAFTELELSPTPPPPPGVSSPALPARIIGVASTLSHSDFETTGVSSPFVWVSSSHLLLFRSVVE